MKSKTKEDPNILDNLTGGQIQEILDFLIYEAIGPIIRRSNIFNTQIYYLLGVAAKNKKRKLSALPREEFINVLCQSILVENEDRIGILSKSKIERSFIYNFVVKFLEETKGYQETYQKYLVANHDKDRLDLKLQAVERNLGCSRMHLLSVINVAQDYLELAYKFRNSIVEQYVKLAYGCAKAYCSDKTLQYDVGDVAQNFLAAITKAVDKYDSSKGALTSYIKWWILNARSCSNTVHGHEYGVAYSIPHSQKKMLTSKKKGNNDINFSISLDSVGQKKDEEDVKLLDMLKGTSSVDEEIETKEDNTILKYLIKRADINGLARLSLDVDEYFSIKEKKQMKRVMRRQLGIKAPNCKELSVQV
jgi:hypothetical protein